MPLQKHRRFTKGNCTNTQTEWFLIVSFSFLCSLRLALPILAFLSCTHKHTHINSPLGVCCFHYLQLGPETAFRVEYSEAELAGIAVYIERSLVIASSLFSLPCASGGKYESVASGDHPAALHSISLQLSVPPPGTSNSGKTESLRPQRVQLPL